jgi:hypothetical protein
MEVAISASCDSSTCCFAAAHGDLAAATSKAIGGPRLAPGYDMGLDNNNQNDDDYVAYRSYNKVNDDDNDDNDGEVLE